MLKKVNLGKRGKKLTSTTSALFDDSLIRNDREVVFNLVRELVYAQFHLSDQELTNRLWQDVADRNIDINRVINLMYCCNFHDSDEEMLDADTKYQLQLPMI